MKIFIEAPDGPKGHCYLAESPNVGDIIVLKKYERSTNGPDHDTWWRVLKRQWIAHSPENPKGNVDMHAYCEFAASMFEPPEIGFLGPILE